METGAQRVEIFHIIRIEQLHLTGNFNAQVVVIDKPPKGGGSNDKAGRHVQFDFVFNFAEIRHLAAHQIDPIPVDTSERNNKPFILNRSFFIQNAIDLTLDIIVSPDQPVIFPRCKLLYFLHHL